MKSKDIEERFLQSLARIATDPKARKEWAEYERRQLDYNKNILRKYNGLK